MRFKIFFFFWVMATLFCFNYAGYSIDQLNASLRVFIMKGKFSAREFDEKGLPVSHSPKLGEFQSPFYIVHYAIFYSERLRGDKKGFWWRHDPSLELWNFPPKIKDEEDAKTKFKNSVDWLVDNVGYDDEGNAHFFYSFDWKYKGYPNGGLKSPWWSGLTDAYAIIPLLRAYDLFQDEKYLSTARRMYLSSVAPLESGGSLTHLNEFKWIEEYVDPRVTNEEMLPFVFNGMVYSTYGILSYEAFHKESKFGNELIVSILSNVSKFNDNGWSYYDILGNKNNIKYHRIHSALLSDLIDTYSEKLGELEKPMSESLLSLSGEWIKTDDNPGFYYLLHGPKTVGYYHFISTLLAVLLMPLLFVLLYNRIKKKHE